MLSLCLKGPMISIFFVMVEVQSPSFPFLNHTLEWILKRAVQKKESSTPLLYRNVTEQRNCNMFR